MSQQGKENSVRRNDWLTAQTVQRMQELLSAISELSVFSKLTSIGLKATLDVKQVEQSRSILLSFLDRLDEMIKRSRTTSAGLMLGADPELGAIARRFLARTIQSFRNYPGHWQNSAT
jgi:hypothetical protein